MRTTLFLLALLISSCAIARTAGTATTTSLAVSSQAVGNIVATGTPLTFTVTGAQGEVTYRVNDYFGHQVTEGEVAAQDGRANFTISALCPGYYQLLCMDSQNQVSTSLGVVMDRGNAPLPREGRICADSAAGWLVKNTELFRPYAHLIRLAGIPWVRERISWSEVEPEPGRFNWTTTDHAYQQLADSYASEGIFVEQIWHDSPKWTHRSDVKTRCPEDLRTVYTFAKAAASHYTGQYHAWEIWNEPDISDFWDDLSDRYAGFAKAAYLGLKDGDPTAQVFPGGLCIGYTPFAQHTYDSLQGYADGFNWHIYRPTEQYATTLGRLDPIRTAPWLVGKPTRLTEAGVRLATAESNSRKLAETVRQQQCQFIPRFAATSIATGNEKAFYFVLPDYMEGNIQFGALCGDLTPNPSFVALSAAANIIGVSMYRGEYPVKNGSAYAFSTPNGNVVVAWADEPVKLVVPTEKKSVQGADIFGATHTVNSQQGKVSITIGPEAVYLLDIGGAITRELVNTPQRPKTTIEPVTDTPSRIVLVGHTNYEYPTGRDAYVIPMPNDGTAPAPISYTVDAYNFQQTTSASGTITVTVPDGWRVEPTQQDVTLKPMDRQVLTYTISPPMLDKYKAYTVTASGSFGAEKIAPTSSYFGIDPRR